MTAIQSIITDDVAFWTVVVVFNIVAGIFIWRGIPKLMDRVVVSEPDEQEVMFDEFELTLVERFREAEGQ